MCVYIYILYADLHTIYLHIYDDLLDHKGQTESIGLSNITMIKCEP